MLEQFLLKYPTAAAKQEALEQLVMQHPYFIPAQFELLTGKKETDEGYAALAAKNAVLFNDQAWLHFQLKQALHADTAIAELDVQPAAEITETETAPPPDEIMKEEKKEDSPALLKDILTQTTADEITELPAFQPLHTSDYFASVGIKLSEELKTGDKLGHQLKSFTEWLKSMKKVHPERIGDQLQANTDNSVQSMAEKSNTEGDVVTEAMAEVLAIQGKKEKAIATYQKLSLLNPDKSAFFAAKIEQLKRS